MPSHCQVHKVRKLVLTKATGVCAGEATSQMQLNWRRVKKEYFSVYLFRSAVTANAVLASAAHDHGAQGNADAIRSVPGVPRGADGEAAGGARGEARVARLRHGTLDAGRGPAGTADVTAVAGRS